MFASYLLTILLCMFTLCYLLVKSKQSPLRSSFTITQIISILWLSFALNERFSTTFDEMIFNMRLALICLNLTAPMWLITRISPNKIPQKTVIGA